MMKLIPAAALVAGLALAASANAQIVHINPGKAFISRAVTVPAGADMIYVSGITPQAADKTKPTELGDTKTQTVGVLNKIKAILEGLGLGMADVVKMQVFLVHDARAPMDFKAFMEGYTQFFGGSQPNLPARSVVGVASLANPGFLVEIEVIAAKDNK